MADQVAKLNHLKIAPRKVRAIAGIIQGLSLNEAEAQLLMQRRRAAQAILKLLRSAAANAKNNQRLEPEKLFVKSIQVNQGSMLKRYLPRARGMATPIEKKMSHITLILGEGGEKRDSRFTIVIKKKTKLHKEEKRSKPSKNKNKANEETFGVENKKDPGFFKKVFSRKSGIGN